MSWYTKKETLPPKLDHKGNLLPFEVFEDNRFDLDMAIESILKPCHLEFRRVTQIHPPIKSPNVPSYICRYKIQRKSRNNFQLVAINHEPTPKRLVGGGRCLTTRETKKIVDQKEPQVEEKKAEEPEIWQVESSSSSSGEDDGGALKLTFKKVLSEDSWPDSKKTAWTVVAAQIELNSQGKNIFVTIFRFF